MRFIAVSGGRIVGSDCIYYQDRVTGVGSNAADIATDAFCTFAVILHHRKCLSWTFDTLNLLIRENILRSSIVASFNSVFLYITVQVTDAFTMEIFFILQICVYSVLVNGELLFIQARQDNFKSRASSAYESGKTPY
ncbi:hypothetical protein HDU80_010654 [Chytriomyces hyalinus]|nr:hypothetical protein HDU80_010654 [Chytriomyces hyalinus]